MNESNGKTKNAEPSGSVAKQLLNILPNRIIGCVQAKRQMDDRTMGPLYECVHKPYISSCERESGFLYEDSPVTNLKINKIS